MEYFASKILINVFEYVYTGIYKHIYLTMYVNVQ